MPFFSLGGGVYTITSSKIFFCWFWGWEKNTLHRLGVKIKKKYVGGGGKKKSVPTPPNKN